jgi:hypothetical protein
LPSDKRPSKAEADGLKVRGLGRWRKQDGNWVWMERIENDNPWDFQNTILKMAAKRAKVAATLNATAASDIFTQDVEDMDLTGTDQAAKAETPAPPQAAAMAAGQPAPEAGKAAPKAEDKPRARPDQAPSAKSKARKDAQPAPEAASAAGAPDAAPAGLDLEALRRQVAEVMTLTKLELLWKDNAKTYEADPAYREIRTLFIDQRQFIQEAQAMERSHGQGEAA